MAPTSQGRPSRAGEAGVTDHPRGDEQQHPEHDGDRSVPAMSGRARHMIEEMAVAHRVAIIAATTLPSPVMPIVLRAIGEDAVYTPASSVTQSCRRDFTRQRGLR